MGYRTLTPNHAPGKIPEEDWLLPTTMYGCNKLACEQLGHYFSAAYQRMASPPVRSRLDFRCLRFPGLISAQTVPSGGTSDYGPEMLHHAAQGKAYACFVRPDTRLPFMVMPDAIKALLLLTQAPKASLTRETYNVTSFSPSAETILSRVQRAFRLRRSASSPTPPGSRSSISWPADIDDDAARKDWGWAPDYDEERSFSEYLHFRPCAPATLDAEAARCHPSASVAWAARRG